MRVGWLGTGLLGLPMAEQVAAAGHDLTAWNRTAARARPLAEHGARIVPYPGDAVRDAEVVVLMLADAPAIEAVLWDDASMRDVAWRGRTVVQMGTIAPGESLALRDRLAAAGATYLEAPVLGSIPQARERTLVVMVGGPLDAFERWLPLLTCFGPEPVLVGDVGKAAALKLALNQLIAALTTAFATSYGMVRRSGVPEDTFLDILRQSALYAPTFDKKLPRMRARDFGHPNFPVKHLLKDVRLIESEAGRLGLDTTSLAAFARILDKARALGHADDDYSALYEAVDPE